MVESPTLVGVAPGVASGGGGRHLDDNHDPPWAGYLESEERIKGLREDTYREDGRVKTWPDMVKTRAEYRRGSCGGDTSEDVP
jgi:hypothetical protein